MKNRYYILSLILAAVLVAACKHTPKVEEQDADLVQFELEREQKSEIVRLGDYTVTDSLRGGGHQYQYTITRSALDTLGVVTDEDGYRAYDNTLSLRVLRDGALLYQNTFVRSMFRSYLSASDYNQYILMNMVPERVVGDDVRFIISLGDGGSNGEVFVQYALDIHSDGSTTISHHEMFEEDEIDRFAEEKKQ